MGDAGCGVGVGLVEGFVLEELFGDAVETLAVFAQQPPGLLVALVDEPSYLFVDGASLACVASRVSARDCDGRDEAGGARPSRA